MACVCCNLCFKIEAHIIATLNVCGNYFVHRKYMALTAALTLKDTLAEKVVCSSAVCATEIVKH